jgi:two-component system cell cycle response regulator DivK
MAKILIVDDNRMILQALSEHLEEMGHDTEVADGGLEALDLLETLRPDLIIMDIVLPGMSGIEVTKKIRANPALSSVPVVAFTSQSNHGQWATIFDDYLVKPFGYDDLAKIVNRFISDQNSAAGRPR